MSKDATPELIAEERRMYERRADWELQNVKKALSVLHGFMNDARENSRLVAVTAILRERASAKRKVKR